MKWVALEDLLLEDLALESLASKVGRGAKKAEKVHEATEHPHPVEKVAEIEKENDHDFNVLHREGHIDCELQSRVAFDNWFHWLYLHRIILRCHPWVCSASDMKTSMMT